MLKDVDYVYMSMAVYLANLSKAVRKKVGCLVVSFQDEIPRLLSDGVNGTRPRHDNNCEDEYGNTYDYVVHAEINALNKLKNYQLTNQCTLYVTHQPCINCAREILTRGISRVVYLLPYKDNDGLMLLKKHGIEVINLCVDKLNVDTTMLDYSGHLRRLGLNENEISKHIILMKKTERGNNYAFSS